MELLVYLVASIVGFVALVAVNQRMLNETDPEREIERLRIQQEMSEQVTEDLDRFFDSLSLPTEEKPHDREETSTEEEALSTR